MGVPTSRREWANPDLRELDACSKAVMMLPHVMQTLLVILDEMCADIIYVRAKVEEAQAAIERAEVAEE